MGFTVLSRGPKGAFNGLAVAGGNVIVTGLDAISLARLVWSGCHARIVTRVTEGCKGARQTRCMNTKKRKVHATRMMAVTLCDRYWAAHVRTTLSPRGVTCKLCKRRLKP